MNRKDFIFLSLLIFFSVLNINAAKQFTLVIDAGHGGHDVGAKGAFSYEKNINLNVALAFGRYVEQNNPEVKVIYTRTRDVFIPLHQRADIANKNKADVFISIHTNALPAGHIARGLETYTMGMRRSNEKLSAAKRENSVITIEKDYKEHYEGYDPNSPESAIMFEFIHDKNMSKSVELARYVQSCVCSTANRQNKGVKQDVFLVLRETSMPACLIELGFITTPDEERFLNDKGNIDNMARGIYNAFIKYKNKYDGGNSTPLLAVPQNDDDQSSAEDAENRQTRRGGNDVETPSKVNETKPNANEKKQKKADERQQKKREEASGKPVFKVQIIASTRSLRPGSSQFKGLTNVESYKEDDYIKYTYGSSTDYNEIYQLRKTLLDKFPQAFIIAFKNGEKMNINQAIREFKSR